VRIVLCLALRWTADLSRVYSHPLTAAIGSRFKHVHLEIIIGVSFFFGTKKGQSRWYQLSLLLFKAE